MNILSDIYYAQCRAKSKELKDELPYFASFNEIDISHYIHEYWSLMN